MVNPKVLFLIFFLPLLLFAQTQVKVSVSAQQTHGESVGVTFEIENSDNVNIRKRPDGGEVWKVGGIQQFRSAQVDSSGTKVSTSVVFQLYPLKTGNLRIPPIEIEVDGKTYTEPKTTITSLPPTPGAKQAPKNVMPMFPFDGEDDTNNLFQDQLRDMMADSTQNRKLEVLVVAEPSKTEAYVGELITLPFFVNTNENIFRTLEFAGFPTFKDFLKEELILPKTFSPKRVNYRGGNYLRAEVIRFALFPLKAGELLIDPLKMRFEVDDDVFQLRQMFQNQDASRSDRTFLRSSGSVPILVKPLPPLPAGIIQENIPVGQYTIKVDPPGQSLVQNEPFDLKVHVEGRGNVKGIAEPEIKLPPEIQKSKTTHFYNVNTESAGFKDFNLLLVPRASGKLTIPQNSWTYFDPDKKTYQTLNLPPIELNIEGSTKGSGINANRPSEITLFKGEQDFEKLGENPLSKLFWSIPILMYAFAGLLFVQRKNQEKEDELQRTKPWVTVERKFRSLKDPHSVEGLQLIEEWVLSRFKSLSHEQPSFDDLIESLLKKCQPSTEPKIVKLRQKFRELEAVRFGGTRSETKFTSSFDEIKKLAEDIVYSSLSSPSSSALLDDADDF